MTSSSLSLARALNYAKKGIALPAIDLNLPSLSPSQAGCAIYVSNFTKLNFSNESLPSFMRADDVIKDFSKKNKSFSFSNPIKSNLFDSTIAPWFDNNNYSNKVLSGYWLANIFVRGLDIDETFLLTQKLIGNNFFIPDSCLSIRRYPTGGISEKQALILPPIILSLSSLFNWSSPFLIAERLAHTGGTKDKLSILPGFQMPNVKEVLKWNGTKDPVRYFSAGNEFCPRDASMYRVRSETGTVADYGLMASSIMSKQIALPADVNIIDILYGPYSFLTTKNEAEHFSGLCVNIGIRHNVDVIPRIRFSNASNIRSIGLSTELVEAAEILRAGSKSLSTSEIQTSFHFLRDFSAKIGLNDDLVIRKAEEAIISGKVFDDMLSLWKQHRVHSNFLKRFSKDPKHTLLDGLPVCKVFATKSGEINFDIKSVSDIANNFINQPDRFDGSPLPGGIELCVQPGDLIQVGDLIANIYTYNGKSVSRRFRDTISYN